MKFFKKQFTLIIIFGFFITGGFIYDSNHGALTRLKFTYVNLKDNKIPDNFDNMKIAFFGDLHYGSYLNQKTLDSFIEKLNQKQVDIVIFLGDVFDEISITETLINEVITSLSKINAPYGKFAILGDQDITYSEEMITYILFESGFETLKNEIINIYDSQSNYIQLVALDNIVNGANKLDELFSDYNYQVYSLAISHTPDIVLEIPKNQVNRLISAHSQNGQIRLPFFNHIDNKIGANYYPYGHHELDKLDLNIVSGLGTKIYNRRIFSQPEIMIYQFP